MFTGIVEELGTVAEVEDQRDAIRLTIRAEHVLSDAALGDSISVNGCCLTVAERTWTTWTADVMWETLDKTSLAGITPGDAVNLERAVTPQTRLGRPHHPRPPSARRQSQPRGRRPRQTRREVLRAKKGQRMTLPQHAGVRMDSIERAIADFAAGKAVVVVDDEDRENEGDLIFAASKATPELLAFTIRWSSGVICVPMPGAMLDRLEIPLMTPHNRDQMRTAYTISVDARDGVTTGISAADRAHTARVLADSATEPWEITRPGHVFPLRYREGGVLARRGHTEAAVDLARTAGLTPAGVLVEIVNDDGTMKRAGELREFADEHGLAMISIEDLVRYRRRTEVLVERVAETRLPTSHGDFTAYGYRITVDDSEHVALVYGDRVTEGEPRAGADPGALGVPDR